MKGFRPVLFSLLASVMPLALAATPPILQVVAQSNDTIWNAVAVGDDGRVYVAGPRWTGSRGASLAVVDQQGQAQPYPDAAWNTTSDSVSPTRRFVNVNAIHRDQHGGLWVVDAGVTGFGGEVIPGAAKLVRIDLASGKVTRVLPFPADIARTHSYIDDIRFAGSHAYLTDAGEPGLVVLDLRTGKMRRVLNNSPSTRAPADRDIVVDGETVRTPDGQPLHVQSDPLEVSPDGQWLYFASLEGPWSRVETRRLNDPALSPEQLQQHVKSWADLPPVGGTTMDASGNLYFTDLAANALRRLTPDHQIQTILVDARLHWVDAPTLDKQGRLYLPVPQIDRAAMFHNGQSKIQWPVRVYRLEAAQLQVSQHE
ncbi:L-dopachrome tautomerase-related protein [Pseudomonas sp. NA-150]|uniref:L-dopachrome tautomerase-related protein n=1 Tax=Pseudomonas sp. NA-150 TaxID=3367525 RepID=UPI0037C58E94